MPETRKSKASREIQVPRHETLARWKETIDAILPAPQAPEPQQPLNLSSCLWLIINQLAAISQQQPGILQTDACRSFLRNIIPLEEALKQLPSPRIT